MTTLLAIGDLHLGRLPANLPEALMARKRELGPDTAWRRAVAEAIARKVDGVVLAGDLVEHSRDFFIAYGELKSGLEKLATAGIRAWAVAGNHDVHVLPRLARELDQLTLLGAGGQWETAEIGALELIGWSFPQAEVHNSPLDNFPSGRAGRPRIGLLHCDRDQLSSRHAPVSSQDLAAAKVSAWLLGHIHKPDRLDGDRPIGYLGSISALRASETGDRGPWLIELQKQRIQARQLVLAPLRYEAISLDAAELKSPEALPQHILASARERVQAMSELDCRPDALGLRLELTGRCRSVDALASAAAQLVEDSQTWNEQGVACFIDKLTVAVEPAIALDELASRSDPAGLLARRILALRGQDPAERERLIGLARERLNTLIEAREFRGLERALDDQAIAVSLERAALKSLGQLLAQQAAA